ncbi:MAG: ATP-binding cassette domain-containing protein [Niabella sp.]
MKIQLDNVGKRYNRDWIFRHFSHTFLSGNSYAITGPNGSGKSTLLQVLSSAITLNEGSCAYFFNDKELPAEKVFKNVALCAPYLELIEEFTLAELLAFHQSFKPFMSGFSIDFIVDEMHLSHAKQKRISEYSSGMKQRAKLAQCIFSDVPVVLLDEPCTNLDDAGIDLYHYLMQTYCKNRLLIVSSNDKVEYSFCEEVIDITRYK